MLPKLFNHSDCCVSVKTSRKQPFNKLSAAFLMGYNKRSSPSEMLSGLA